MATVLTNALLVDLDPPQVEAGGLRIERGQIAARGLEIAPGTGDEVVDCRGAVVLPGLVNGHTHLYSALAVGMPAPERPPRSFREILEKVWWPLDEALDAEAIEISARIGAIEAVRCGTTTLVDHHASPNAIEGSLDRVEAGLEAVGVRGVLCYETTDRHGRQGRDGGIEENRRYLARCAGRHSGATGRFAGMVGAHAAFTLSDTALRQLAELAGDFQTGVHIHVAEDSCDDEASRQEYQRPLIERLQRSGVLTPAAVFAHCTHLDSAGIAGVNEAGLTVAHNPRSNMVNAVGYAPVGKFSCPVMLGTDGIGSDLLAEARAAFLKSREEGAGLTPAGVVAMLARSARRASRALGVKVGQLAVGAEADVVVTDYLPFTPLDETNLAGHLLFGLSSGNVRHVMVGGRWVMRDREVATCDERAVRREAVDVARRLWEGMGTPARTSKARA